MAEDSKWISKAISRPGRLTQAASRAGLPLTRYARKHAHDPQGTIGDAARMYLNVLKPIHEKKK